MSPSRSLIWAFLLLTASVASDTSAEGNNSSKATKLTENSSPPPTIIFTDSDTEEAKREGRAVHTDKSYPHPNLHAADEEMEDEPFQSCRTPHGDKGHCRHVRYCVLDEFRDNFDRFRDYACVIEGKYIGVCCPDSMDISDKSRDFEMLNQRNGTRSHRRGTKHRHQNVKKPTPSANFGLIPTTKMSNRNRLLLRDRGCGVANALGGGKVEGGRNAEPGGYPWMAALLRQGEQQFCGGALIDSRHVLTAAHCVYNLRLGDIMVSLGEYDLSRPDPTRVQAFGVSDIRVHEQFNADSYTDDIAVIELDGEVEFTPWVWPICLPPPDIDLAGQMATVIGWGTVYYGGPPSDILMNVMIPVWSQEDCQSKFVQPILDTELCAGSERGGKDSCQGDSGGPLLLQMDDGQWCNIGIVSFGVRCGEPDKPGVYTRVSKYLDWIAAKSR